MLTAVVALYFVFALVNLRWATLILPLFFPTYLLAFKVAGIPFNLIEGFIGVTFAAWVLRGIWNMARQERRAFALKLRTVVKNWQFVVAIVLILLGAVIGTLITAKQTFMIDGTTIFEGQKVALGILKSWIVLPIMMTVLFRFLFSKKEDYRLLLDFYTASAFVLSVWAIWQVISGSFSTPDQRASGPFNSANYLALYITPALLYVFARFKKLSFIKVILFLVIGAALFFTKSYAAMIALFISTFFYFGIDSNWWKAWRQKKMAKAFWGVVLSIIFGGIILGLALYKADPVKWNKFFEFTERSSSSVRVEIYTIAVNLIKEHPLEGIGLGQFPLFYQLQGPRILGHDPFEWNMLHPHNIFLAFWLNLGIFGLVGLFWILILVYKKFIHEVKGGFMDEDNSLNFSRLKVIVFAMLLVVIIHGFFDTPFFKNDLSLLFWLLISVII